MCEDECAPEPLPTTPPASDGGYSLPERIFGALTSKRHRYILYYLQDNNHTTVETLATQLAAWELDSPRNAVPPDAQEKVMTSLNHADLPKLADYGLIEYDERSGTVRYTDAPALLEEALALAAVVDKPD